MAVTVGPAGLDEGQRLADRRPAQGRPGDPHAYALYLVKFVQAYQAAGVPIYA